jgi:hypothetical protein
MPRINRPNQALANAIANDRNGVVSEKDAQRIVRAAVADIAGSNRPEATFEENKRFINAARTLVGGDVDTPDVLNDYSAKGMNAVTARLAQLTGAVQLPLEARRSFEEMVGDYEIALGSTGVELRDVQGNPTEGFSFKWDAIGGAQSGEAFALKVDGGWFFSPKKVSREILDAATANARAWFDANWAIEMRDDWGSSDAEIEEARESLVPERMLFGDYDSDPYNFVVDYPLCFQFNNATGSDHGFYMGIHPDRDEYEMYDFN